METGAAERSMLIDAKHSSNGRVSRLAWGVVALMLTIGMAAPSLRAQSPSAPDEHEGVSQARWDLRLGFTITGKVERIAVEPGDRVEQGQVLIELVNDDGKALEELWRLRADSEVEVDSAEARLALAEVEAKRIRSLLVEDAASDFELQRAELQVRIEALRLVQAREQRIEARAQLDQAAAAARRFVMIAPRSGVIDEIVVSAGEIVSDNTPVLRLVQTDPLRVDVPVQTYQTLNLATGDQAWVAVREPGYQGPWQAGRIIHLAKVADGRSGRRLVRVELANPNGLPSGLNLAVRFTPPTTDLDAGVSEGTGAGGSSGQVQGASAQRNERQRETTAPVDG